MVDGGRDLGGEQGRPQLAEGALQPLDAVRRRLDRFRRVADVEEKCGVLLTLRTREIFFLRVLLYDLVTKMQSSHTKHRRRKDLY